MHPQISINTLCLPTAALGDHAEAVARLGARGISPGVAAVLDFGVKETARSVRDVGLEVATITHLAFGYATLQATREARERLLRTIDIAAEIGMKAADSALAQVIMSGFKPKVCVPQ